MSKTSTHFRFSFISLIKTSLLSLLLMTVISCGSSSDGGTSDDGGSSDSGTEGTAEAASLPEALTSFKTATSELGLTE